MLTVCKSMVLGAVRKPDAVQWLVLARASPRSVGQSSSIDRHPIKITTVNERGKSGSNPATMT